MTIPGMRLPVANIPNSPQSIPLATPRMIKRCNGQKHENAFRIADVKKVGGWENRQEQYRPPRCPLVEFQSAEQKKINEGACATKI